MKTIHFELLKTLVAAMIVLTANTAQAANLVVNGDFENTTSGITRLDISNASFNGFMPDVTAFGELQALDIVELMVAFLVGETSDVKHAS